ncbi:hypothetical protein ACDA63_08305 [Uliginosibacterium sp. sgz301328]|uniref:hypothetical protein n=1 Tax=Uliginosibacterium sp. sgz301328 TaxID=3243764 RepID=UPI00359CE2B7
MMTTLHTEPREGFPLPHRSIREMARQGCFRLPLRAHLPTEPTHEPPGSEPVPPSEPDDPLAPPPPISDPPPLTPPPPIVSRAQQKALAG